MKYFRSISLNRNTCPPGVYAAIVQLRPENAGSVSFHLEAKPGDEKAARLVEHALAVCKQHGLKQTRGTTVGSFVYTVDRVYERVDLQAAPLLLVNGGRPDLHEMKRDSEGRFVLPATRATSSLKLASVFPTNFVIISDAVRQTLESGGLHGLSFGQVVLSGKSIHAVTTPFWELGSSLTLPKTVNSIAYEDSPFPCYGVDEPPFGLGEPHYRSTELEATGKFDIARTHEPLGGPEQALIVSQRFYQHCLKNRIPLEVRPVRIDPD